jgi:hypothetical protein
VLIEFFGHFGDAGTIFRVHGSHPTDKRPDAQIGNLFVNSRPPEISGTSWSCCIVAYGNRRVVIMKRTTPSTQISTARASMVPKKESSGAQ